MASGRCSSPRLCLLSTGPRSPLIETVAVAGIRSGALDYGRVRLWGSLSFIVASLGSGLLIGTLGAETVLPLLLAERR